MEGMQMKALSLIGVILVLGIMALAGCSEDAECPTCTKCPSQQWVAYDNFGDNTLDTELWSATVYYGGQVLETSGQLQLWGHTDLWTGAGIVRMKESRLAWRFDLVETYFEEGPGCQGWHIRAIDPANGAAIEVLNECSAGCTTPPTWADTTGAYEIRNDGDSLAVYRDGSLLRRVYGNGINSFVMEFVADNVYGSGHHSHIFVDNFWGLEWKP
jgi:hypothetical protein